MDKSVLLVDDEEMTRDLLRLMLKGTGFKIYEAEDGFVALEQVEAHKPDIMILDVMMPGLDGLAVCRTLRSQPHTAELPVIMLSAKTTPTAIQDGLDAGANKYLTKPVGFKELLSSIKEVLGETVSI
ncbi:MAG: response regulator [Ardenticatenaceae bacterium]|nr:response regulator [Ardenticatenaceae bacterium]